MVWVKISCQRRLCCSGQARGRDKIDRTNSKTCLDSLLDTPLNANVNLDSFIVFQAPLYMLDNTSRRHELSRFSVVRMVFFNDVRLGRQSFQGGE